VQPAFELAVFDESSPVSAIAGMQPEVRAALYRTGVPKDLFGGRYTAVDDLTVRDAPGFGRVVQFGSVMQDDPICVDPATGQVLELPHVSHAAPLVVNSSLNAFTETVRVVLERFPYYDEDAEFEEIRAVAHELGDLIRRIDPVAMATDQFWSTFVDDVEMGDFATEDNERHA
jgi:hypothetical protein